MAFDHAQSARLGQRVAPENPGVQLCTVETLPEVAFRGQIVYLLDIDEFKVYDGVAWQAPAAGTGASQTFVQDTEPVADEVGDQWLNTNDYQMYVWDGFGWRPVWNSNQQLSNQRSLLLAAAVRALVPLGTEANIIVTYAPVAPLFPNEKDLWVNTTLNEVNWRLGSSWSVLSDPAITDPIQEAGEERSISDLRIELFYDSTSPMGLGPEDIGDIWTDTGMDNMVRVWTGAAWLDLQVDSLTLGESAVSPVNIKDLAVTLGKIDVGAVEGINLVDFAVTADKLLSKHHYIM